MLTQFLEACFLLGCHKLNLLLPLQDIYKTFTCSIIVTYFNSWKKSCNGDLSIIFMSPLTALFPPYELLCAVY